MTRICLRWWRSRFKNRRKSHDEQRPSLVPLALALFLGQFGYVVFIAFAPVKNELALEYQHGRGMSSSEFEYFYSLMYTAYGFPNFFMPLLSGVIVDRIGASKVLMFCSGLITVGAFFLCEGSLTLRPSTVLTGRFFLGIGNESVYVAAVALLGEFLPINDLSTMNGVIAAGMFIANAFGSLLAVPAFRIGSMRGLCVLLVGGALVQLLANIECVRQRKLFEVKQKAGSKPPCREMLQVLEPSQSQTAEVVGGPAKATPRGIAIFVLLVLTSVGNTLCVWNFSMILCPLLEETWPPPPGEPKIEAEERAGAYEFIFMMVPAVGSPIIGAIVSAFGCPGFFVLWSTFLQTMGHCIFALAARIPTVILSAGPLLPLVMVSHSNSFIAPMLYQCIALTLPARHAGKAFGLMVVVQNIAMGLWPLLVAHLEVASGSYQSSKLAFASAGVGGVVLCGMMLALDWKALGGSDMLLTRTQHCKELTSKAN